MIRYIALLLAPLTLTACGGSGGGGNPPASNSPPSFTSAQTASAIENQTGAYQATATDPDGNALTFTIDGGADAARFSITPSGAVTFNAAPDYDLPGDANGDNIYEVRLKVSDGTAEAVQLVNIAVTNSNEGIYVKRILTGLNQPTSISFDRYSDAIFVTEKTGRLLRIEPYNGRMQVLTTLTDLSTDGERGLLGAAQYEGGQPSPLFLLVTATNGDIEVRRFYPGAPSMTEVALRIPHADHNNHNGGWIKEGPDRNIYVGIGDGGGVGDPNNNAQNPNSRLGKILRFRPSTNPGAYPYTVVAPYNPAPENPFLTGGGDPYVYALGLRNPFSGAFSGTNMLIADVGQDAVEEINLATTTQPGINFGWKFMEGTRPFSGSAPAGLTPPVAEYFHGNGPREGRSIISGVAYRNEGVVPALHGQYVFADYVSGNIWTVPVASLVPGQTLSSARFARRNEDFAPNVGNLSSITAIGANRAGYMLIATLSGDLFIVYPLSACC